MLRCNHAVLTQDMQQAQPIISYIPLANHNLIVSSKQPNIPKQQYHHDKKPQPNPPPNTRPLRHTQHAIHRAPQPDARVVEAVVHLVGQGGGVTDFVADGEGNLLIIRFGIGEYLRRRKFGFIEGRRRGKGVVLTSFNILTLALIPSNSPSF